jgi:hypothetical protein
MNIYLNNANIDIPMGSRLKSGGKVTPFYPATFRTIFYFYIKTRFSITFLLPGCRSLPHIFILDLLSDMFLTLIVLILFT